LSAAPKDPSPKEPPPKEAAPKEPAPKESAAKEPAIPANKAEPFADLDSLEAEMAKLLGRKS
jgi:hypothetical protein